MARITILPSYRTESHPNTQAYVQYPKLTPTYAIDDNKEKKENPCLIRPWEDIVIRDAPASSPSPPDPLYDERVGLPFRFAVAFEYALVYVSAFIWKTASPRAAASTGMRRMAR